VCCRFILHNSVGSEQFSSLLNDFVLELTRSQPSLIVVGGLRMMLNVDNEQGFCFLISSYYFEYNDSVGKLMFSMLCFSFLM
jgi:hypothetical protein